MGHVTSVDNNGAPGVPRVVLDTLDDASGNRARRSASIAGSADFQNQYRYDVLYRLTRVDQMGKTGGNRVAEQRVDLACNTLGQFMNIVRYQYTDGGSANEVWETLMGHVHLILQAGQNKAMLAVL